MYVSNVHHLCTSVIYVSDVSDVRNVRNVHNVRVVISAYTIQTIRDDLMEVLGSILESHFEKNPHLIKFKPKNWQNHTSHHFASELHAYWSGKKTKKSKQILPHSPYPPCYS